MHLCEPRRGGREAGGSSKGSRGFRLEKLYGPGWSLFLALSSTLKHPPLFISSLNQFLSSLESLLLAVILIEF